MKLPNRRLRVFICHSPVDQLIARDLVAQLRDAGWMDIWFIESSLAIQDNWEDEIRKEVNQADVVIALISTSSFKQVSYIYPEPNFVFSILDNRPMEDFQVIPLRLGRSGIPAEIVRDSLDYLPKNQRKIVGKQILDGLAAYASERGFALNGIPLRDDVTPGFQWTPVHWKKVGGLFLDELFDEVPPERMPIRPPSKWQGRISAGLRRLIYSSLTIIVLVVVVAVALIVRFVNTGKTVNSIAEPIISGAMTLIPLPTPTPGVGSIQVSPIDGMRMVYVPAGEFIMGSEEGAEDERPARTLNLAAYWIDQYEVTNGMYKKCVDQGECSAPRYRDANEWFQLGLIPLVEPIVRSYNELGYENYPISRVTWNDAVAYCAWAGRRLPTEAEWEKAARGTDGRTYPWGETADCRRANIYTFPADEACAYAPTRVGSYEDGVSPFGAYDMAGNVYEFVSDDYVHVFESTDDLPFEFSITARLRKGGSWINPGQVARSANREMWNPMLETMEPNTIEFFDPDGENGFRCVTSADAPIARSIHTPAPTQTPVAAALLIDSMQMIYVPAGPFVMGGDVYFEEKPVHAVTLDAFWIDQTEVTNAMFVAFLNNSGNHREGGAWLFDVEDEDTRIHIVGGSWQVDPQFEDHPVVEVTWYGASAYCAWAGKRLPTEAEWEKAARGTSGYIFPWGNDEPTADLLNFDDQVGATTPVGTYAQGASPYGAFDMAGNVWEWVADIHSRTYYSDSPLKNPLGPETGVFRVMRGGGWNSRDTFVRSMHRNRGAPTISHDFVGFRCARSE